MTAIFYSFAIVVRNFNFQLKKIVGIGKITALKSKYKQIRNYQIIFQCIKNKQFFLNHRLGPESVQFSDQLLEFKFSKFSPQSAQLYLSIILISTFSSLCSSQRIKPWGLESAKQYNSV